MQAVRITFNAAPTSPPFSFIHHHHHHDHLLLLIITCHVHSIPFHFRGYILTHNTQTHSCAIILISWAFSVVSPFVTTTIIAAGSSLSSKNMGSESNKASVDGVHSDVKVVEGPTRKAVRPYDVLLRFLGLSLTLVATIIVGVDKETKIISYAGMSFKATAKWEYMSATV